MTIQKYVSVLDKLRDHRYTTKVDKGGLLMLEIKGCSNTLSITVFALVLYTN